MVLPADKRIKFFVFIIESPSEVDFFHDYNEARPLNLVLEQLIGVKSFVKHAITKDALRAAIRLALMEKLRSNPGLVPVLHISAHGSMSGIQLSNGETLRWAELRELLIPINQAVGGCLLVCMSTCEGYAGTCMAMEPNGEHPFFALVGNSGKPTWGDTATAFLSFYHLFAKGHYLADAVSGMRVASGDEAFFLRTAEDAKRGYIEYLEKLASGQETLSPIDTGLAPAGLLGSAERKGSLETVAAAAS